MSIVSGLRKSEVEQLLRLTGRIQEQPAGSAAHDEAALTGISGLVGARAALFVSLAKLSVKEASKACRVGCYVSLTDVPVDLLKRNICEAVSHCPAWERLLERCQQIDDGQTLVVKRSELVPDSEWYAVKLVQRRYEAHGIDHFLCAIRRLECIDRYAMLLTYRSREAGGFRLREQQLLQLFWATAGWLTGNGDDRQPEVAGPVRELEAKLSPRLKEVLGFLLRGYQADLIAEELGLSVHTIYEHMKRLYVQAGVRDRRALIAKLNEQDSPRTRVVGTGGA